MEVLFITHKYPPSVGGMQKQSYELINGVSKYFKIHTLIYDNESSIIRFLLSVPFKVKKILKENPNISLIHLNDGLMAGFSLKLKRITTIPIAVTIHGLDIVFPSKLFQKFIVKRFREFDAIIAVSKATAEECFKRGFDRNKVYVVRNGVDTDMAHIYKKMTFRSEMENILKMPLADKKILVSVGRSVKRKGFSWFISRVLPKLDPNIIYVIVGPRDPNIFKINFLLNLLPDNWANKISLMFGLGLDEIDIKKALRNKAVRNRAFYLGKLPYSDMVQVLKHADLFVMPNIKVRGDAEGFGLVALEAAINGLPVVASAIEGITCAIIDGENGFLVPAEKENIWVEKINTLLSDHDSLKQFGEVAKHYSMTNYAWDKMVEGYISVFKKVLTLHSQPAPAYEQKKLDVCSESVSPMLMDQFIEKNA
jgi:glycosyltransferase involved in cell wall biosynthesis